MQAINPYQTPAAVVADAGADQYAAIKVLSAAGRLGRLRYISYSMGFGVMCSVVVAFVHATGPQSNSHALGLALTAIAYIGLLVIQALLTIQRCHDFNRSGWLSLLALVPIVNLIFSVAPGTRGSNRFGAPPPPNSTGVVIVALILPVVFVVGLLAAIAIPAYSDYVQRAKASHVQQ